MKDEILSNLTGRNVFRMVGYDAIKRFGKISATTNAPIDFKAKDGVYKYNASIYLSKFNTKINGSVVLTIWKNQLCNEITIDFYYKNECFIIVKQRFIGNRASVLTNNDIIEIVYPENILIKKKENLNEQY